MGKAGRTGSHLPSPRPPSQAQGPVASHRAQTRTHGFRGGHSTHQWAPHGHRLQGRARSLPGWALKGPGNQRSRLLRGNWHPGDGARRRGRRAALFQLRAVAWPQRPSWGEHPARQPPRGSWPCQARSCADPGDGAQEAQMPQTGGRQVKEEPRPPNEACSDMEKSSRGWGTSSPDDLPLQGPPSSHMQQPRKPRHGQAARKPPGAPRPAWPLGLTHSAPVSRAPGNPLPIPPLRPQAPGDRLQPRDNAIASSRRAQEGKDGSRREPVSGLARSPDPHPPGDAEGREETPGRKSNRSTAGRGRPGPGPVTALHTGRPSSLPHHTATCQGPGCPAASQPPNGQE